MLQSFVSYTQCTCVGGLSCCSAAKICQCTLCMCVGSLSCHYVTRFSQLCIVCVCWGPLLLLYYKVLPVIHCACGLGGFSCRYATRCCQGYMVYIVYVCWRPVLLLCYKVLSVIHSACVLGASLVAILQSFISDTQCMCVGGLSCCYTTKFYQ